MKYLIPLLLFLDSHANGQSVVTGFIEQISTGKVYIINALSRDTLVKTDLINHQFISSFTLSGDIDYAVPSMLLCVQSDHRASTTIPLALEEGNIHITIDSVGNPQYSGSAVQEKFSQFIADFTTMMQSLLAVATGHIRDSLDNQAGTMVEEYYMTYVDTRLALFNAMFIADIIQRKLVDPKSMSRLVRRCENPAYTISIDSFICKSIDDYQNNWIGQPYIDFTGTDELNHTVQMKEFVGLKPILIDFWASWCGPCIREMPSLRELYDRGDIEIIGISIDASATAWLKSLDKLQLPWINIRDVDNTIAKRYQVTAVPTKLVIDKNGIIIARNPEDLETVLAGLR